MTGPKEKESHEPIQTDDSEREPSFPVRGYIMLNLFFWAFCLVEILLFRWWLKDIQGIIFFFGLLAVGFTLVSIYDAAYDRVATRLAGDEEHRPPISPPK